MKKIFLIPIIAVAFFVTLSAGCESAVETEGPNSQLTAVAVFESAPTANAALADIYAQIREYGILSGKKQGSSYLLGCYADELTAYEFGPFSAESFFNNALVPSDAGISGLWNASYNQIYAANAVIEGAKLSSALSVTEHQQITGEALFIRALLHVQLTGLFGNIPYIETTDYRANSIAGKKTVEQVYDLAITDLEQAVLWLPEAYTTPGRIRPNRATAQALLARVYLYDRQWAEASNMASAVLNQTARYHMNVPLEDMFLKSSPTTIWQLGSGLDGDNANEGNSFILQNGPPDSVALTRELLDAFEPGDLRKTHWVGSVTNGTDVWYFPYKYKQRMPTGSSLEYSVVFRLSEQYLIRSEARAMQGDLIGATEDLNVVRNKADLGNTTAQSAVAIVNVVMHERRVELFTEQGHRFLDLKRSGNLGILAAKPGWNPEDALWPLPQTELLANGRLLPQNPGY